MSADPCEFTPTECNQKAVVEVWQGSRASPAITMMSLTNEVYDLTDATDVILTCVTSIARTMCLDGTACTVADAENGVVTLPLTPGILNVAGIFESEITARNVDEETIAATGFFLVVRPSLRAGDVSSTGISSMPTIMDVRRTLHDKCADDNYLLDDVEFTDTEIVYCMLQALREFDEMPPRLPATYGSGAFPWTNLWLLGTAAHLLSMAGHKYTRNRLDYSAGGVSVQDKAKGQEYEAQYRRVRDEWWKAALRQKQALNLKTFTGIVGRSDYYYLS